MSLTITTREITDVIAVGLAGRITLGEATGQLRDTVRKLVSDGHKKVLFNLEKVEYIDSAGLGEIVGAYTTIKNSGGVLKMVKVQGRALDLMQITRLMTLFEFFDDEAAAAKSFD